MNGIEDLKSDSLTIPHLRKRELSCKETIPNRVEKSEGISPGITPPKISEDDADETQNAIVYQQIALTRMKNHAEV